MLQIKTECHRYHRYDILTTNWQSSLHSACKSSKVMAWEVAMPAYIFWNNIVYKSQEHY